MHITNHIWKEHQDVFKGQGCSYIFHSYKKKQRIQLLESTLFADTSIQMLQNQIKLFKFTACPDNLSAFQHLEELSL